ncbi:MAG: hypothetical protein R3B53_02920 [Candidatus Paceibacterota bacterium]
MLKSTFKQFVVATFALLLVSVPTVSQAQVYYNQGYQPRTAEETIAYLFGIMAQLQAQLDAQKSTTKTVYYTYDSRDNYDNYYYNYDYDKYYYTDNRSNNSSYNRNPYFVNVVTLAPISISRNSATLKAEVDRGSSDSLDVWFEYGVRGNLSSRSKSENITYSGRRNIEVDIDRLKDNTTYNYRVVAEDENGYRHYGQTRSFSTVSSASTQSFYGRPTAETEGAKRISYSGAELSGFVSMNDYDDGLVFFVYGRDRSDVNDADDYDSYDDIKTDYNNEDIKKTYSRNDFNGRNTVTQSVGGLKNATTYYYRVCVEYDDRGSELRCGQVESFTTLNNW